MLAERFRCTEAVSRLKAQHNLPPADLTREAEQIERLRKLAEDADFNPDFAVKFLNFIIKEVIRHHDAVKEGRHDADLVAPRAAGRMTSNASGGSTSETVFPRPAETGR